MRNLIDNTNGIRPVAGLAFEVGRSEALSKPAVHFEAAPHGDEKCGRCWHFDAEGSKCQIVEGDVQADNWCAAFAPKA